MAAPLAVVLANALAGQTFGVTCMQWALKTTQAGIVTAIIATTPLVLLPLTRIVEGEKIGIRSLGRRAHRRRRRDCLTFFR